MSIGFTRKHKRKYKRNAKKVEKVCDLVQWAELAGRLWSVVVRAVSGVGDSGYQCSELWW